MSAWQSDFIHANGLRITTRAPAVRSPRWCWLTGVTDDGPVLGLSGPGFRCRYDVIMVDARATVYPMRRNRATIRWSRPRFWPE